MRLSPSQANASAGENALASAGQALVQSISVTPSAGWYVVCALLLLALVAQFFSKISVSTRS